MPLVSSITGGPVPAYISVGGSKAELVRALLLPGEIKAVAVAVEQLSGYRKAVLAPYAPQSVKQAVGDEIQKN